MHSWEEKPNLSEMRGQVFNENYRVCRSRAIDIFRPREISYELLQTRYMLPFIFLIAGLRLYVFSEVRV
jgi:hypothetical protein